VTKSGEYHEPWTFQDFLLASRPMAYKSDNMTTVDSFFNDNNIYIPFLEEVIKDLIFWGFFSTQLRIQNIASTISLSGEMTLNLTVFR
jgi:hypothetical protein